MYQADIRRLARLKTTCLRSQKSVPNPSSRGAGLHQFMSEVKDPQLAFGVRQKSPTKLDEVVAATLQLETYLSKTSVTVAGVESDLTVVSQQPPPNKSA